MAFATSLTLLQHYLPFSLRYFAWPALNLHILRAVWEQKSCYTVSKCTELTRSRYCNILFIAFTIRNNMVFYTCGWPLMWHQVCINMWVQWVL